MKALSLLILFLSAPLHAERLYCSVSENFESVSGVDIQVEGDQKALIARTDSFVTYVSKKKGSNFEVEMFLPELEIRTYGLGALKTSEDRVGTSIWSRERLLDVVCYLKTP